MINAQKRKGVCPCPLESVGVMPISAGMMKNTPQLYPGLKKTQMKYGKGKRLYDVEVLKVSSKQLN